MGEIYKILGPLVTGENLVEPKLNEIVKIGEDGLIGEIVRIIRDRVMIQVYEPTEGLKPGDKIEQTGEMFMVELGPGLVKQVFDGIQRPLKGDTMYLEPGFKSFSLDRKKKWSFVPSLKTGAKIKGGEILGSVKETNTVTHNILVPPEVSGELQWIASRGDFTVEEIIAKVETKDGVEPLKMYHKWPVRIPRPYKARESLNTPLVTGLRVVDFFFPAMKGGTIAIPGGFGTGKTQLIFQLIKWSDADVLIYVGCGERGNEVITVLDEISHLKIKGELLDERTIYVINTSNMPVAARTSGIFSGITIAEYFRDQGKNVVVLADSTTRWAEAMREISNRIGDYPGEEGYPTYLASEIGNFFERAGNVRSLSGEEGSITTIGTVSLYGSDFSDPVAQASMKVVNCLWALDPSLAYARHYPAINRNLSYSKSISSVDDFWKSYGNWTEFYQEFLQISGRIEEIMKLTAIMGKDMLSDEEQFLLDFNELYTELFLKQSSFIIEDCHRDPEEQLAMAALLITYHKRAKDALKNGFTLEEVSNTDIQAKLLRLKRLRKDEYLSETARLLKELVFVKKND